MPVDNVGTDTLTEISGETVQLYYHETNGVLTIDAGEAIGTIVVGKFTQRNIKNALGDVTGTHNDSSLSFTSTALLIEVEFPYLTAELYDAEGGKEKAEVIVKDLSNGEYCIDYRTGAIYGKKISTQATLTSTAYKVETTASGTPGGVAEDVNVSKIGGTVISDTNPMPSEIVATSNTTGMSTVFDSDGDNSAQAAKASPGNLYMMTAINTNTADAYLQLFDLATGSVTVGTTPPKYVVPVLGGAAYDTPLPIPMSFSTAITYACTTTPTGSGDPTVGLTVCFGYK